MIGLTRLTRAIADVPTSGMQTGDPKVRLKLCDAQRIEVEFNAIIAERDAALAQNADLVAQVAQLELNTESLMSIIKSKAAAHINMNVAEIQADAGRAGFVAGVDALEVAQILGADFDAENSANDYAERVKAGE